MTFRATDRRRKDPGLVSNSVIVKRQALNEAILCPLRQCALNVWELAFRPSDGRTTSLVRQKVFLLIPQNFGNSTSKKESVS